MDIKFVCLVVLMAVGGYVGYGFFNSKSTGPRPSSATASYSSDPTVFPYSKTQVQTMLTKAKTTLPRRDGGGQIQIWGVGHSAKGVSLNMQYASWAPLLKCEAVITEIAPNQSRVAPACGSGPQSDSALSRTQDELRTPMFEEHIQATLNNRAFNRSRVDQQEAAAVFKNLGGMQREALQSAAETPRLR